MQRKGKGSSLPHEGQEEVDPRVANQPARIRRTKCRGPFGQAWPRLIRTLNGSFVQVMLRWREIPIFGSCSSRPEGRFSWTSGLGD